MKTLKDFENENGLVLTGDSETGSLSPIHEWFHVVGIKHHRIENGFFAPTENTEEAETLKGRIIKSYNTAMAEAAHYSEFAVKSGYSLPDMQVQKASTVYTGFGVKATGRKIDTLIPVKQTIDRLNLPYIETEDGYIIKCDNLEQAIATKTEFDNVQNHPLVLELLKILPEREMPKFEILSGTEEKLEKPDVKVFTKGKFIAVLRVDSEGNGYCNVLNTFSQDMEVNIPEPMLHEIADKCRPFCKELSVGIASKTSLKTAI